MRLFLAACLWKSSSLSSLASQRAQEGIEVTGVWSEVIDGFHPLLLLPASNSRKCPDCRKQAVLSLYLYFLYIVCLTIKKKNLSDIEWLGYLYAEATSQVVKFIQSCFYCCFEDPLFHGIGRIMITIFWNSNSWWTVKGKWKWYSTRRAMLFPQDNSCP